MKDLRNQILCGDCTEILQGEAEPFADTDLMLWEKFLLIAGLSAHHTLRVGTYSADTWLAAVWVAALAIFVLAEKVSRRGEAISVIGGVAMIVWGVAAVLGG